MTIRLDSMRACSSTGFYSSPASSSSPVEPPFTPPQFIKSSFLGCSPLFTQLVERGFINPDGNITDDLKKRPMPALPKEALDRLHCIWNRDIYNSITLGEWYAHFKKFCPDECFEFVLKGSSVFWVMGEEGITACLKDIGIDIDKPHFSDLKERVQTLKPPHDADFDLLLKGEKKPEIIDVITNFETCVSNKSPGTIVQYREDPGKVRCEEKTYGTLLAPISKTPIDVYIHYRLAMKYLTGDNALKICTKTGTLFSEDGMNPWQAFFDWMLQRVNPHPIVNDHGAIKIARDMAIKGSEVRSISVWQSLQNHVFNLEIKKGDRIEVRLLEDALDFLIHYCETNHPSGHPFGLYCIALQEIIILEEKITSEQRKLLFQKYPRIQGEEKPLPFLKLIDEIFIDERFSNCALSSLLQWAGMLLEVYGCSQNKAFLTAKLIGKITTEDPFFIQIKFSLTSENSSYLHLNTSPLTAYSQVIELCSIRECEPQVFAILNILLKLFLHGDNKSEMVALWKYFPERKLDLRGLVRANRHSKNRSIRILNFLIFLSLYAAEPIQERSLELQEQRLILLETFPAVYAIEGIPKKPLMLCFKRFFGPGIKPILDCFHLKMASTDITHSLQVWVEAFIEINSVYSVKKFVKLIPFLKTKLDHQIYSRLVEMALQRMKQDFPQEALHLWASCGEQKNLFFDPASFLLFCHTLSYFTTPESWELLSPHLFSLGKMLRGFSGLVVLEVDSPFLYAETLYRFMTALNSYPKLKKTILDMSKERKIDVILFGKYHVKLYPESIVVASTSQVTLPLEQKVDSFGEKLDLAFQSAKNRIAATSNKDLACLSWLLNYSVLDHEQKKELFLYTEKFVSSAIWDILSNDFKFTCDSQAGKIPLEIFYGLCKRSFELSKIEDGIYFLDLYFNVLKKEGSSVSQSFIEMFSGWLHQVINSNQVRADKWITALKSYQALQGKSEILRPIFTENFVTKLPTDSLELISYEGAEKILQKELEGKNSISEILLRRLLQLRHLNLQQWKNYFLILRSSTDVDLWMRSFVRAFSENDVDLKKYAFEILKNAFFNEWMAQNPNIRIACLMLAMKTSKLLSLEDALKWLHSYDELLVIFRLNENGKLDPQILDAYLIVLKIVIENKHENSQYFLIDVYAFLISRFSEKEYLEEIYKFEYSLLEMIQKASIPLELTQIFQNVEQRMLGQVRQEPPKVVSEQEVSISSEHTQIRLNIEEHLSIQRSLEAISKQGISIPLELIQMLSNTDAHALMQEFPEVISENGKNVFAALCFFNYQHPEMKKQATLFSFTLSDHIFNALWIWDFFYEQAKKTERTVAYFLPLMLASIGENFARGTNITKLKNEKAFIERIFTLLNEPEMRSKEINQKILIFLNDPAARVFFGPHSDKLIGELVFKAQDMLIEKIFRFLKSPRDQLGAVREEIRVFFDDPIMNSHDQRFGEEIIDKILNKSVVHQLCQSSLQTYFQNAFILFKQLCPILSISHQTRLWEKAIILIAERFKRSIKEGSSLPQIGAYVMYLCLFEFDHKALEVDENLDYCDRIKIAFMSIFLKMNLQDLKSCYFLFMNILRSLIKESAREEGQTSKMGFSLAMDSKDISVYKLGQMVDDFLFKTDFEESIGEDNFRYFHKKLIKNYSHLYRKKRKKIGEESFYPPLIELISARNYVRRLSCRSDLFSLNIAIQTFVKLIKSFEDIKLEKKFIDFSMLSIFNSLESENFKPKITIELLKGIVIKLEDILSLLRSFNDEEMNFMITAYLIKIPMVIREFAIKRNEDLKLPYEMGLPPHVSFIAFGVEVLIRIAKTRIYSKTPAMYWTFCSEYADVLIQTYPKEATLKLFCGLCMTDKKVLRESGFLKEGTDSLEASSFEEIREKIYHELVLNSVEQIKVLNEQSDIYQAVLRCKGILEEIESLEWVILKDNETFQKMKTELETVFEEASKMIHFVVKTKHQKGKRQVRRGAKAASSSRG